MNFLYEINSLYSNHVTHDCQGTDSGSSEQLGGSESEEELRCETQG